MAGSIQGPGKRPLSEINVTPFVDVVLVLLIIFMVTAPMMQQGIDVDLPETESLALRMPDEPLILTVKKDSSYFIGATEVALDELEEKLRHIFDGRGSKEIFLRADQTVPYGAVAKAMAAARKAGATQLGMVTEPEGR